jgi:hypothetical protein
LKIDFEGRTWQVELNDIGVKQAQAVTAYMGNPSLVQWAATLADTDNPGWLKSMECLYWLMRAQAGEPVVLGESEFSVLKLSAAWGDAGAAAEAAKEAAADEDPTRPAGEPAAAEPIVPAAFLPG